jgi:hypothetical protein
MMKNMNEMAAKEERKSSEQNEERKLFILMPWQRFKSVFQVSTYIHTDTHTQMADSTFQLR